MMKTLAVAVAVALCASVSFAGEAEVVLESKIKVVEYVASVGGPVGCTMPADLAHPKAGECEVKKAKLETGWKLVKVGNQCFRSETNLTEMPHFEHDGKQIDAPATTSRRVRVDCPA